MPVKKFFLFLFLVSTLLWVPAYGQSADDHPGTIATQENATNPETKVTRYTMEVFMALSDDAKRDVYFNFPEQLPDNFSPEPYMDIFYPAQEPGT